MKSTKKILRTWIPHFILVIFSVIPIYIVDKDLLPIWTILLIMSIGGVLVEIAVNARRNKTTMVER